MIDKEDLIQKIKDDIFLTGKQLLMDNLPENQNAMFIGKMRIPTKAHIGIIEEGIKKFNHVVVAIIKAEKNQKQGLSFEMQKKILDNLFGDNITIITNPTANMTSLINKSPKRIKYILAGSDRVNDYAGQLARHPKLKIVETKRKMDDSDNVSATKLIDAIENNDKELFKKMSDSRLWPMFDELKKAISK